LQAKTLEKGEKTAKYFTPPMGGGPPGALTPYQRGGRKGRIRRKSNPERFTATLPIPNHLEV